MKRKVSRIGPATLMVSLPSKWVKKNNIKKGDEIELKETDHALVLSPATFNNNKSSVDIEFKTLKEFHKRCLEIPYIEGIDELNVSYSDPRIINLIQLEVDRLLGLEIVDQKNNRILIKNIARGENEEIEILIRRLFLMLTNSVEESKKHLRSGDYKLMEGLVNTEKISSKLVYFCLRALNIYGFKNQKKTYAIFTTIWAVEQILDAYRDLAKHLIEDEPKIKKEEIVIYEKILDYLKQFYDVLYNFDREKFIQFYYFKDNLDKDIKSAIKTKDSNKLFLTYLHGIFDRVYHMGIFISPSNKSFM